MPLFKRTRMYLVLKEVLDVTLYNFSVKGPKPVITLLFGEQLCPRNQ